MTLIPNTTRLPTEPALSEAGLGSPRVPPRTLSHGTDHLVGGEAVFSAVASNIGGRHETASDHEDLLTGRHRRSFFSELQINPQPAFPRLQHDRAGGVLGRRPPRLKDSEGEGV